jgi:hypothetical protein
MSDPGRFSHLPMRSSTSPGPIHNQSITILPPEVGQDPSRPPPPPETLLHLQYQTRLRRIPQSIPFTPISTNPIQHDLGDFDWSFLSLAERSSMHGRGRQREEGGNDASINACAGSDSRVLDHQPAKVPGFQSGDPVARSHLYASGQLIEAEPNPCRVMGVEGDGLQRQSIHSMDTFVPVSSGAADVYQDAARCRDPIEFNFAGTSMMSPRAVNHLPHPTPSTTRQAQEDQSESEDSDFSSSASRGSSAVRSRDYASRLRGPARGSVVPPSSHGIAVSSHNHLNPPPEQTKVSMTSNAPYEYPAPDRTLHFNIGLPLRQSTPFQRQQHRISSPTPFPHSEAQASLATTSSRIESWSFTDRQRHEIDGLYLLITECLGAVKRMAAVSNPLAL